MKMLAVVLFAILSVVTACATSQATPTSTVSTLAWDAYIDTNGKGFYVYWKDKSNTAATYTNVNRTQITSIATVSEAIALVVPLIHPSSLCFVLTAYDGSGNESGYSNEVCGFTGFTTPANVKGQ